AASQRRRQPDSWSCSRPNPYSRINWPLRGRNVLRRSRSVSARGLGGGARFPDPDAGQDVGQRIIALVAGLFEHALLGLVERVLREPGGGVNRRILDRVLVEQLLVRQTGEALDHFAIGGNDEVGEEAEAVLLRKTDCFDHQRVAVPAGDGI